MQTKNKQRFISFILCIALTVAMALFATACNGTNTSLSDANASQQTNSDQQANDSQQTDNDQQANGSQQSDNGQQVNSSQQTDNNQQANISQLGEGSMKFHFTVVDKEGAETAFEIHTDKETVGDALLEVGLIAGEESQYGLYVKTVNGITVDYDKDGVYWAFYVNDEYALTGVDSTLITEGDLYSFKVE